jgi:hypothetical protein
LSDTSTVPTPVPEPERFTAVPAPIEDCPAAESGTDSLPEKTCLRAALDGNFRRVCKDNGYFAEDMAARINEIFLDLIGDIVLSDENGDYVLIEDYREDVTEWLS